MDTDETTKTSSPMPEEKPSWQILVLWVQLLPCFNLIATGLLHRIRGKEMLHFAACQMVLVFFQVVLPWVFWSSLPKLECESQSSRRTGRTRTIDGSSCSCLETEEHYPACRTKTPPKVRETLFRSVTSSVLPCLHKSVTAAKTQVCTSLNSLKSH